LGDIDQPEDKSGGRLEGIPPKTYDGDRAQTHYFFTQFKRFALMNRDAKLIKDPVSRCAYFLSLIDGPRVKGWVQRQLNWLDKVEERDEVLPWNMNAWDILQREFKKAFVDYAEHERAYNELRALKIKDGDVYGYIYTFEELAGRSGVNPNEPTVTRMFTRGLPRALAESCIDQDSPESFEQWTSSAQMQQKNWMKKRSLHDENERPAKPGQGQGRNLPPWRRNAGANSGGKPRLPPADPDAMDTSAAARKAVTEQDKEKHRAEGRCIRKKLFCDIILYCLHSCFCSF
jgi:hypothetical protein